jgi:predicted acyltransferase
VVFGTDAEGPAQFLQPGVGCRLVARADGTASNATNVPGPSAPRPAALVLRQRGGRSVCGKRRGFRYNGPIPERSVQVRTIMGTQDQTNATPPASGRLLSIDALRGFDMFWIIGGDTLARALAHWAPAPVREQIDLQLEHVPWEGFHFYDLIFPLFLFLVGVVLPFSLGKLQERQQPRYRVYARIARRTVLLFALGLLYNHFLQLEFYRPPLGFDFSTVRLAGVLQRIAVCYGVAALVVLHTRVRGQIALTAAVLLGYWALLALVPVPGSAAGDYSLHGNLAGYVDAHYLPGKILKEYYGYGDNEGLLSTIPAVATALLGALAGHWLRSGRSGAQKFLGLAAAGAVCLLLGWAWGFWFPIIKNLWTSSFVLFAGGWSLLLLALFYGIIDVLGLRRWAFFFVVIGANAITIYLLPHIIDFEKVSHFFLGGVERHAGDFGPVVAAVGVLAAQWLVLLYLYRRRLFLRV